MFVGMAGGVRPGRLRSDRSRSWDSAEAARDEGYELVWMNRFFQDFHSVSFRLGDSRIGASMSCKKQNFSSKSVVHQPIEGINSVGSIGPQIDVENRDSRTENLLRVIQKFRHIAEALAFFSQRGFQKD